MSDSGKTNVLLFGLGAIGGFYAFVLNKNDNVSLSVIARSNYDAVKQSGLVIESPSHGTHKVRIDNIFKTPSEATQKFDYIVCCHKAIKPTTIPPLFKHITSPTTTFVIIQNGIGNEDPFRSTFPQNPIISCITWTGAIQSTPGTITHNTVEDLQIGLFPISTSTPPTLTSLESTSLTTFATLLATSKTPHTISPNIQHDRWHKLIWNATWNPLTTLTLLPVQTVLHSTPEALATTRQLMHELILVAQNSNIPLKDELAEELIQKVLAIETPLYSSMCVDAREGRALEVEVILGSVMRRARELGMEERVPVLRAVYALLSAVDQRLSG